MAKYGKLNYTVLDSSGNAVSGASVEVRKQGATVNGDQSGGPGAFVITVNDLGAIAVANTVAINTGTTTYSVQTIPTDVSFRITPGAALSLTDDDRVTIATSLPTLYSDSQGAESKSNPLTTDSSGEVTCWVPAGYYDLKISGSSITTKLVQDKYVPGESALSSVYDDAAYSAVAFIKNTERALVNTATVLEKWQNDDTDKFIIGYDGGFTATGSARVVANLTASGVYSPLGNFTALTATSLSVTMTLNLPDASVTTADLASQAVMKHTSATATGSATLGLSYVTVPGCHIDSYAINGSSSILMFWGHISTNNAGVANTQDVDVRIRNTSDSTTVAELSSNNEINSHKEGICLFGSVTGLTGSKNFELQGKSTHASDITSVHSGDTYARLTLLELKV